ncbi:MAG: hypothetical protein LBG89_00650 [Rickettsiales bacterium]|jgi:hypothetical protein|nr:hypothetical protein [Rickettsiales bacterium]
MMNMIKNVIIAALVVMSALWAWDKFGSLLLKKTGRLTPDSNLAEWNVSNATERELIVRNIMAEPARVARITDCITIMATISESQKLSVKESVPLCISGTFAADHLRTMMKSE